MIKFTPRLMVLLLCGSALAGCADAGTTALNGKPTAASVRALAAEPPADLESGIRQAALLRQAEHYDEAVHILSQLMLVASDDARVVGEYGKTLAQMGRAQDATEFLGRAVQLQPNDWSLYSALGVAYDEVGDQASARSAYEHALKLKPGEVSVLNNYALSRLLAKDPAGAEQLMARARAAGGASDPKIARNIGLVDSLTPAPVTPANKVAAAPVAAPAAPQSKPVIAAAQPVVIVPAQPVTAAPLNPIGQPHPLLPAQVAAQTVPPATAKPHAIDKFAAAPVAVAVVQTDGKKADNKPVATASVKTATVVAPLPAKTDAKPVQIVAAKSEAPAPVAAKSDSKPLTDSKLVAKTDSKPVPDSKTSATVKTATVVAPLPAKTDAKPVQTAAAKADITTPVAAKSDSKPLTDTKLAAKSDAKPVPPVKTANTVAPLAAKTDAKPVQTAAAKADITTPVAAKSDSKPAIDTKLAVKTDSSPVSDNKASATVKTATVVAPLPAKTDAKPVQTAAAKSDTTTPAAAKSDIKPPINTKLAVKSDATVVTVPGKADGKSVSPAPLKTASTTTSLPAKSDGKPVAKADIAAAEVAPVKTASTTAPAPVKADSKPVVGVAKTDTKPVTPTKLAAKTDAKSSDGKTGADAKAVAPVKTADAQNKNGVPALRLAADRY